MVGAAARCPKCTRAATSWVSARFARPSDAIAQASSVLPPHHQDLFVSGGPLCRRRPGGQLRHTRLLQVPFSVRARWQYCRVPALRRYPVQFLCLWLERRASAPHLLLGNHLGTAPHSFRLHRFRIRLGQLRLLRHCPTATLGLAAAGPRAPRRWRQPLLHGACLAQGCKFTQATTQDRNHLRRQFETVLWPSAMDEYCITCPKANEPRRGNPIDWFPLTHTTHHHPQQCQLCSHSRRAQPARPREHSCMHHVTETPPANRTNYKPLRRDNAAPQSPTHVASLQGSA